MTLSPTLHQLEAAKTRLRERYPKQDFPTVTESIPLGRSDQKHYYYLVIYDGYQFTSHISYSDCPLGKYGMFL
jgi:hypothetical protein